MKGATLAVMVRAPVPGQSKTRLQPELTPEQCASLSLAFLKDAIDLAVSLPFYTPFLAYTPRNERRLFAGLAPGRMGIIPQTDGDLGERMHQLMVELETRQYSPITLIGTDIPMLQPETLLRAVTALEHTDLCLGPSHDGGYYLIGANRSDERIFQNIAWSSVTVLKQTRQRAREAGLSVTLLGKYSDVDTFDDLKNLISDIDRLHNTTGARIPQHTDRWLKQNHKLFE